MTEQRTTPRVGNGNERIDEKTLVNELLYARLIPFRRLFLLFLNSGFTSLLYHDAKVVLYSPFSGLSTNYPHQSHPA